MFQRIKASIDSALEQEQARARALHGSPTRSASGARRVASRAISPTKRATRPDSRGRQEGGSKGPDPADFEAEFVIDDDLPSRSGTPKPVPDQDERGTKENGFSRDSRTQLDGEEGNGEEIAPSMELPTDVRVKLRKLEKLEGRYQELLRSYRMAHARVQTIDAFETSLRENTPLTSISDPKSLVEYLNQVNLKGDMVLDELKRVSNERDSFKQRLAESEKKTKEAWDEVAKTRVDKTAEESSIAEKEKGEDEATQDAVEIADVSDGDPLGATQKSPTESNKSPTIKIPSMTLFSPKLKSVASPQARESSEDLFSYDGEIPRLEKELHAKQENINGLEIDVQKLKTDLTVTRESTQSMVQTLEEATREVNAFRESRDRSLADSSNLEKTVEKLRSDLQAAEERLEEAEERKAVAESARIGELGQQVDTMSAELQRYRESAAHNETTSKEVSDLKQSVSELEALLSQAKSDCELRKQQVKGYEETIDSLRSDLKEVEAKNAELIRSSTASPATASKTEDSVKSLEAPTAEAAANSQQAPSTSKKKNKKKKKGAKSGAEPAQDKSESSQPAGPSEPSTDQLSNHVDSNVEKLLRELEQMQGLLKDKDALLDGMRQKLKDQDGLTEEIETLRDDLINVGQEHVAVKDKVKELLDEKRTLEETVAKLEDELEATRGAHASASAGSEQKNKDLASQFDELKTKASMLQTDLSAAQQLASSRFKDLENLRSVLQKAQPEINALRSDAAETKSTKEALAKKEAEFKRLDSRHEEMRSEVTKLRQTISSLEAEIKFLNQRNTQEASGRSKAEEASEKSQQDVTRLEVEKRRASESLDTLTRELEKTREDLASHKARVREVEQQYLKHRSESAGLKEEIELKTAQYASAQSLMASMRDQTAEMAMQTKEARDRCESLDEEVADAHRLLNERSREGETMRRLLADIEARADSQTRAMKERMDTAIEERDRAEEDASTSGRRRARELEELRNKYRDLERSLKRAEEDKEELELSQRDWKRRREELEYRAGQSTNEVDEVRRAMGELRDALDESEKQGRELEKQKAELRRSVEETQHRLEKLQKSNKSMAEEIGKVRESKRALDSEPQSHRTSMDTSTARIGSPAPPSRTASGARIEGVNGQSSGQMDYVYLKNVLLQFLEQKDKKHQMQLIPVLGMLLHFDRKDEQKWMSAITTKA